MQYIPFVSSHFSRVLIFLPCNLFCISNDVTYACMGTAGDTINPILCGICQGRIILYPVPLIALCPLQRPNGCWFLERNPSRNFSQKNKTPGEPIGFFRFQQGKSLSDCFTIHRTANGQSVNKTGKAGRRMANQPWLFAPKCCLWNALSKHKEATSSLTQWGSKSSHCFWINPPCIAFL